MSGSLPSVTDGTGVTQRLQPVVLFVQQHLPHYRVPFFELLRQRLADAGVVLHLSYGEPTSASTARAHDGEVCWARRIDQRVFGSPERALVWQPVIREARQADLVVVEQANRLLVNFPLLLLSRCGIARVAFWGHGQNFQAMDSDSLGERFKRWYSRLPHWWFAYNERSARVVQGLGYPKERITVVRNAIDTTTLRQHVLSARKTVPREPWKCIFVGGMYPEKRLSFLVEAAQVVKQRVPEFRLVLVGAGIEQEVAQRVARTFDWIEYKGPLFGEDLACEYARASVFLMPGSVGLAVLDSFAAEVPMITTAVRNHGPEIEYLVDGCNGVIVKEADSPQAYAEAVADLLRSEDARRRLERGCAESSEKYTVEEMVRRFASGIMSALEASKRPSCM